MPGISQFSGKQINMATTPRALESLRRHIGDSYIAQAAMAYLKASIELHSYCVEYVFILKDLLFNQICCSKELRDGWEDSILNFKTTFDKAYDAGIVFETPKVCSLFRSWSSLHFKPKS